MVGRMAMNNTWEIARMDHTFFPDEPQDEKLTREEMMVEYGKWL